jgi:drug/metabolite transporter (DMT)-like permease
MTDEPSGFDEPGEPRGGADPVAFAFVAMMVLITSTTATAAKVAVRELPTGLVPLVRFGVAGLILLPFVWKSEAFRRLWRRDPARLALAAVLCVPVNQFFFLNGTKLAPTVHVALIYAACPLIVLALATAIGQERPSSGRLLSVLASVAGVVVIALGNLGDTSAEGRDVMFGDLLEVFAVTSWGAYIIVSKPLVARYGPLPALAGTFLVGVVLDLPIAAATGRWTALEGISTGAWLALGYLAVVASIGGLLFQNLALGRLDASQVATFGNVAPLLTMAWGHLLFGERLTPALALGGGLIMLGLLGATRPLGRPAVAAEPSA